MHFSQLHVLINMMTTYRSLKFRCISKIRTLSLRNFENSVEFAGTGIRSPILSRLFGIPNSVISNSSVQIINSIRFQNKLWFIDYRDAHQFVQMVSSARMMCTTVQAQAVLFLRKIRSGLWPLTRSDFLSWQPIRLLTWQNNSIRRPIRPPMRPFSIFSAAYKATHKP